MPLKIHINSLFSSVSYRLGCVLIDPGDEWEGFENVVAVLLTHTHFDHIYGLNRVVELNPKVRVYTNEAGKEALFDDKLNLSCYYEAPFTFQYGDKIINVDNENEINIGKGLMVRAYYTPGHNPSCITWVIGNIVFTGDSYIPGVKTVTNLPNSNKQQALDSENLILRLCYGKSIYPGHEIGQKKWPRLN